METKTDKLLRKNYVFFQNQLPTLLRDKNKKDKFALIKDEQIVGVYDTVEKAMDTAIKEKQLKWETFLVQKIEKQQVHHIYKRVCV
ncbi:MAG: hypothetical protein OXM55_00980 [Bdellovibrionales bacterium]|nr:hypothetical protein [Bdellovibrionales bacterium]